MPVMGRLEGIRGASAAGLEEGIVTAELKAADLAAVRESRMGYFQAARRPELYRCR